MQALVLEPNESEIFSKTSVSCKGQRRTGRGRSKMLQAPFSKKLNENPTPEEFLGKKTKSKSFGVFLSHEKAKKQFSSTRRLFFPKNSSGVGFSFSFLDKGAWSEIGRSGALVYAKHSF